MEIGPDGYGSYAHDAAHNLRRTGNSEVDQLSHAEELLMLHIRAAKLPEPIREYRFYSQRKWRFDIAWLDVMLAVEVDGGMWVAGGGRHNRGQGFSNDLEKRNHAVLMGWRVLGFTPEMIKRGEALQVIERALEY